MNSSNLSVSSIVFSQSIPICLDSTLSDRYINIPIIAMARVKRFRYEISQENSSTVTIWLLLSIWQRDFAILSPAYRTLYPRFSISPSSQRLVFTSIRSARLINFWSIYKSLMCSYFCSGIVERYYWFSPFGCIHSFCSMTVIRASSLFCTNAEL